MRVKSIDEIFWDAAQIASPVEQQAYLDSACADDLPLRRRVEELLRARPHADHFLENPVCNLSEPQVPQAWESFHTVIDGNKFREQIGDGASSTVEHCAECDRPDSTSVCDSLAGLPPPPPAAVPTLCLATESATEQPNSLIGPYMLLEQIGEGGMGLVFVAEQTRPIRRKVALKLIKPGMDTRAVIARFEAERQALALMDHPNIAKVLDAGETASGRPYFVMELVDGVPITDYCKRNNLTPRQRLGLFLQVCQAIQHAHQKGIIHRDIKPTNVLVTPPWSPPSQEGDRKLSPPSQGGDSELSTASQGGDTKLSPASQVTPPTSPSWQGGDKGGVVRVIDFGVAKAIGQQLTDKTLYTYAAQLIGTPLYMSPEQAQLGGVDVDTRTDIYSLGVMLYELLAGSTPFDRDRFRRLGYEEILRIIREEEPPTPSTRLRKDEDKRKKDESEPTTRSGRQRFLQFPSFVLHPSSFIPHPSSLSELDWIVMKAMEKDRERRYETVSAFAADIERYLHNEPVEACPPSAWYRFRKFALRRKAALAVAAGGCVALVLLAVSNVEMRRAQGRVEAALSAEEEQRRRAEENLGLALQALDEIFLKPAEAKAGSVSLALTPQELERLDRNILQKGLGFYEQFAEANGENPALQGETGKAYHRVGFLHVGLGQPHKAEVALRKSTTILEKVAMESPELLDYRRILLSDYFWLGHVLKTTGKRGEAKEFFDKSKDATLELLAVSPGVADYRLHLYRTYNALAQCHKEDGSYHEAETYCRRGVEVAKRLAADFPDVADYRLEWSDAWRELGHCFKASRRYPQAQEAFRQAAAVSRQFLADFPASSGTDTNKYNVSRALGDALKESGCFQDAVAPYQQAVDLARQIVTDLPDVVQYRRNLLLSEDSLGRLLIHLERFQDAEKVYRQSLNLDGKLPAGSTNLSSARLGPSVTHAALGDLLFIDGRFREALDEYRRALEIRPADGEFQFKLAWFLAACPDPKYRDPVQAIVLAKKALEQPEVEVEPVGSHLNVRRYRKGFYYRALGLGHYRAGEWDQAITSYNKASAFHGGLCACGWSVMAMAHWHRDDKERARRCYDLACTWLNHNKGYDPSTGYYYSKEPGAYWEEEYRRFIAEAAALLGLPAPK
jgi:serine/threonine protein kinase